MRIPNASYRVQLNPAFGFQAAKGIADYLFQLGISDLYASPIFKSRRGSTHGYDIVDPSQLNPELGSIQDFNELIRKIKELGMGWLQDIVPNHMAYNPDNWMLMDVFKNGKLSPYFVFFDVSWHVTHDELKGKLLAPFLAEPLKTLLKKKEIKLEKIGNDFLVKFHDWQFPLKTGSFEKLGLDLEVVNQDPKAMEKLLSEQLYKLAYWKSASEEANYRRFFNISELISLKPEAFEKTHEFIFNLIPNINHFGLRIDHIDGLFDPTDYLNKLKAKIGDTFCVVEKILSQTESLPKDWPVAGTTGYDFMSRINALFCNAANEEHFNKIYADFLGEKISFADLGYTRKKQIIENHMAGSMAYLARLLHRFMALKAIGEKISVLDLRHMLVEILAVFPVYRTYVNESLIRERDLFFLDQAIEEVRRRRPEYSKILDAFERALKLLFSRSISRPARARLVYFLMRFQQYAGPIMAKGSEDTLFYVYNRLLSLNEVGSDPRRFGIPLEEFHSFCQNRDYSLNATSTHDTKRGEDVRARINVLSELPQEWEEQLAKFNKLSGGFRDKNFEYFLYQTMLGAWPLDEERFKQYALKAAREAKTNTNWLRPNKNYEKDLFKYIDKLLSDEFVNGFIPFQEKITFFGIFNSLSQTLIKVAAPGVPDIYQGSELWDLNLVDPDNRRPVDFNLRIQALQEINKRIAEDRDSLLKELLSKKEEAKIKLFLISQSLNARKNNQTLFEKGEYIALNADGRFKDNIISFARRFENKWVLVVTPRFLTRVVHEGELPLGEVWEDTTINLPEGRPEILNNIFSGKTVNLKENICVAEVLLDFPVAMIG